MVNKTRVRIIKDPKERKEEIIAAALYLFSQKGYEHTTIQDIAKYLNISQGLCYRYFKSKSELFIATAEFYAQQVMIQIKKPFPHDMKAIDKFNIIIKRLFEYIIKHGEFEANSEVSALRSDRLDSIAKQIIEVIIPIIEQGNKEGVFACKEIERTTKIFIFGLVHTFHEDMPKENLHLYIKSFLQYLKNNLGVVLNMKQPELLGKGWNMV